MGGIHFCGTWEAPFWLHLLLRKLERGSWGRKTLAWFPSRLGSDMAAFRKRQDRLTFFRQALLDAKVPGTSVSATACRWGGQECTCWHQITPAWGLVPPDL